jgi:hypothetical protein
MCWFLITVKKLVPFTLSHLSYAGRSAIGRFFKGVFMRSLVLLSGVRHLKCSTARVVASKKAIKIIAFIVFFIFLFYQRIFNFLFCDRGKKEILNRKSYKEIFLDFFGIA